MAELTVDEKCRLIELLIPRLRALPHTVAEDCRGYTVFGCRGRGRLEMEYLHELCAGLEEQLLVEIFKVKRVVFDQGEA
jgi:hypothetical protein